MSKETDKKNKSLKIVCIVAVVIILILVGVIIMMMRAQNTVGEAEAEKEKRPVVVLPENAEEVAEQIFSDDVGRSPAELSGYHEFYLGIRGWKIRILTCICGEFQG